MDVGKQDRDTLVSNAIEIASAEERDAYIAQASGDDAELRRQVEERVGAHFQSAAGHAEGPKPPITRIGSYKVLKEIGEGVAGFVFQAEQQEPAALVVLATSADQGEGVVSQAKQQKPARFMVALKVIKDGMDWRQIVDRFEAERRELSLMDNPNIAKVLEAGTRPSGQPYFVSEWVDGVPITKYCDDHQLSPRQRLELFVTVCQAVQYAHQKGVIHGDLKPSNVLVAGQDGKPMPRILDFGVAQATRRRSIENISAVASGGPREEPEYMSPDRADANVQDVDTRGDVYSLGALLYELLTGTTPLPRERLKGISMTEALRLVREEESSSPSTRLVESKDRLASVSAKRHMKPAALVKAVRGELDCLVMKALRKDRTHRYQTANDLARDVQRHLANEPMEACPPGGMQQLWSSARKHPKGLAASVATFVLLLVAASTGTGLAIWEYREEEQARKARHEAVDKQNQAQKGAEESKGKLHQVEAAREAAEKELHRAQAGEKLARRSEEEAKAVLAFFRKNLLSAGRPGDVSMKDAFWAGGQGKDVTLRKAVDMAEPQVVGAFADRPLAEASIREMLGMAYLNLGDPAEAVKQYERALALREAMQGFNHPDTAACRNQLAVAYRLAGRTTEAGRLFDQSPNSPARASALAVRGSMLLLMEKPAEAELKLRESLKIRQKIQPDDWTTFDTTSELGEALLDQKKFDEAEPLLLAGYVGMKKREDAIASQDKPRLIKALERLVKLYEAWGKKDKAIILREELEAAETAKKS